MVKLIWQNFNDFLSLFGIAIEWFLMTLGWFPLPYFLQIHVENTRSGVLLSKIVVGTAAFTEYLWTAASGFI